MVDNDRMEEVEVVVVGRWDDDDDDDDVLVVVEEEVDEDLWVVVVDVLMEVVDVFVVTFLTHPHAWEK